MFFASPEKRLKNGLGSLCLSQKQILSCNIQKKKKTTLRTSVVWENIVRTRGRQPQPDGRDDYEDTGCTPGLLCAQRKIEYLKKMNNEF